MKAKRLLALALALITALAVIPFAATAVSVIPISSAEQLVSLMNDPEKWGGAYYLTKDIDLTDIEGQSPIGKLAAPFTGYFDGMGHSITGLNISGESYLGLFGLIDGATVKNFTVSGTVVSEYAATASGTSRAMAGGAVGAATGNATIQGVISTVSVSSNRQAVGGLVGSVYSSGNDVISVADCHFNGTVKGLRGIGGLIGIVSPGGDAIKAVATGGVINVTESTSAGTVTYVSTTGNAQCGGLIGNINIDGGDDFEVNVINCVNNAVVDYDPTAEDCDISNSVGGIVGFISTSNENVVDTVGGTINFISCVNNADLTALRYTGGIAAIIDLSAGSKYYANFINCVNTGDIHSNEVFSGGIVGGAVGGNIEIIASSNVGAVSANWAKINNERSYVGGILGYGSKSGEILVVDIDSCDNSGAISGDKRYCGGIAGGLITSGVYTISNCRNTGSVSGIATGGIVGWSASATCTVTRCLNIGSVKSSSGSAGAIFGYPQNGVTATNNFYLSGTAKDGKNTEQYGRGNTANGSCTTDDESAYRGLGSENINTSLVLNTLNGTPSTGTWQKGKNYPEITALVSAPAEEAVTEITNISLSVGTDLSFNAFATLADGVDAADTKIVFTYADEDPVEVTAEAAGDLYRYTLKALPPQAMTELITVELYVGDELVDKTQQTVRGYCEQLIDNDENSDELVQLAKDILAYGAAAQEYRDYNLDSLANEGVEGATEFAQLGADKYIANLENGETVDGVKFTGIGVRFDYVNSVFFKLTAPSVDGITVIVNGEECAIEEYGDSYIVYSAPINATEFDDEVVAVLKYGDTVVQTVTYSVASFVYEMQNAENSAAAELAKALYNYGLSAIAYAVK